MKSVLVLAALLALCSGVAAQSSVHLELGVGGRIEQSRAGSDAYLGAVFRAGRWVLRGRLVDVFTVTDSVKETPGSAGQDRYYRDTLRNGQVRCRDRTNGQFVPDSYCSGGSGGDRSYFSSDYTGGSPEIGYLLRPAGPSIELGGGAKIERDAVLPYAALYLGRGDPQRRHLFAAALLGPRIQGAEIGYSFRIH